MTTGICASSITVQEKYTYDIQLGSLKTYATYMYNFHM
jgi:hypothetical protein